MAAVEVVVNDRMQQGYCYERTEPIGRSFDERFEPELTPKQLLEMGIFGGKYMTDCQDEFPTSWFTKAKLSSKSDAEFFWDKCFETSFVLERERMDP